VVEMNARMERGLQIAKENKIMERDGYFLINLFFPTHFSQILENQNDEGKKRK
jgi:hypothetical protein